MSEDAKLVRYSRIGDQFHYLWAARAALKLLMPGSGLVALTVEGPSNRETETTSSADNGDEVIDVAEYYGSEVLGEAVRIRYIQIKHSTKKASEIWQPSGLENTIEGFAAKYKSVSAEISTDKLDFVFVSNRPINPKFLDAVANIRNGSEAATDANVKKIKKFTGLDGDELRAFCKALHFEGHQDRYWEQGNLLDQELSGYLPGADVDAPLHLKEMIVEKAITLEEGASALRRADLLKALKTNEVKLFPAESLLVPLTNEIARDQEAELRDLIIAAVGKPVVVCAEGGEGKSVLMAKLPRLLPEDSVTVVYDCFGNAQYRNNSATRHRHREALVQIANELAAKGLCHPLIPSAHAHVTDYLRAFFYRLNQAVSALRFKSPDAILCLAIDAADNAQMAADEFGDGRSFAKDLIRERIPDGVRLVFSCRTHRAHLLDAPPGSVEFPLTGFSEGETGTLLKSKFPQATQPDVREFHRLSSRNPRVQALAMSWDLTLDETLRNLGPNPKTVEDTISDLLERAVEKLRHETVIAERGQIDQICAGLATLRPLVPISVLAKMAGVSDSAVRSFATDLGRPLIANENTVQFFDEPSETWFRERFKPTKAEDIRRFADVLKQLSVHDSYAAAALPQFLLEVGNFDELVTLALSAQNLPDEGVEKRNVDLQRIHYALKAALRQGKLLDACKLSIKGGGLAAGEKRQRQFMQENTDLAAILLSTGQVQELVSRRAFDASWTGAHHAYEAALLSGRKDLLGEARSRLRIALEWVAAWNKMPEHDRHSMTDADICELVTAHLNIHGPQSAVQHLNTWRPRSAGFSIARSVGSRLVDTGRTTELSDLCLAAKHNLWIALGFIVELARGGALPPQEVLQYLFRKLKRTAKPIRISHPFDMDYHIDQAVLALAEALATTQSAKAAEISDVLQRNFPTNTPTQIVSQFERSRFPTLRGYAFKVALSDTVVTIDDLAPADLKSEIEKPNPHHKSSELQKFYHLVGGTWPWHMLRANACLKKFDQTTIRTEIEKAKVEAGDSRKHLYHDGANTNNEVALLWFEALLLTEATDQALFDEFDAWRAGLKTPLETDAIIKLARMAAHSKYRKQMALSFAAEAFSKTTLERSDAINTIDALLKIVRSVLPISQSEAAEYFNVAVEVAGKIGQENISRWTAILDLADRTGNEGNDQSRLAFDLAQFAELTRSYVDRDKHFDWSGTVKSLSRLSPGGSWAIFSRWHDRGFGSVERLITPLVNDLLSRGRIGASHAIAFTCFEGYWDRVKYIQALFSEIHPPALKQRGYELLMRYTCLAADEDIEDLEVIRALGIANGFDASPIDQLINRLRQRSAISEMRRTFPYSITVDQNTTTEDAWTEVFSGTTFEDAHARYLDNGLKASFSDFVTQVFARAPIGREAEWIEALCALPNLSVWDMRAMIDDFPDAWKNRLALKSALQRGVKGLVRRFSFSLSTGRYYEPFSFKRAAEVCGIEQADLIQESLAGVAEGTEEIESFEFFNIAGLIAVCLPPEDARAALDFALGILRSALQPSDGDGGWDERFTPPTELPDGIAGYLWSQLGDPQVRMRWRAAHTIRSLCALGETTVISALIDILTGTPSSAFTDRRIVPYVMHSKLWLLVTLARIAEETPDALTAYAARLAAIAGRKEKHIICRYYLTKIVVELNKAGILAVDAQELAQIQTALDPVGKIASTRHDRFRETRKAPRTERKTSFHFAHDFTEYWLGHVGEPFGITGIDVEHRVDSIISEWGMSELGHWTKDDRRALGLYRDRDGGGRLYKSTYPDEDDLDFYISYHGMMTVAGELLDTMAVHEDPDNPEAEFQAWLQDHLLDRDGRWLSDFRSPNPLPWAAWKNESEDIDWRFSVQREDFDRVIGIHTGDLCVRGHWVDVEAGREEHVHVYSALVSPESSLSLLIALQTVEEPDSYYLPSSDDSEQALAANGFAMRGWIKSRESQNDLERDDPWAAKIPYPPLSPSEEIVTALGLRSSFHDQTWSEGDNEPAVFRAETWSGYHGEQSRETNEEGRRIMVNTAFLKKCLTTLDSDLLIEVQLRRKKTERGYSRDDDEDDFGYLNAYSRLFLVKRDGTLTSY